MTFGSRRDESRIRFHAKDVTPVSSCRFPLSTVQCDGVTRRLERVRSLRYFRVFSTLGYMMPDKFTLCCSVRHMSHHLRSFPLGQDGGAPAATTKSPTRTHIVRPLHSLSSLVGTSHGYLTLSLPVSPNHLHAPTFNPFVTSPSSSRRQHHRTA